MFSHIPLMYYERKLKTRRYNQYLRDTLDPFDISERCFIDNYRLTKAMVHQLISEITPFIDDADNSMRIPLHLEVLCALNFFASGSHQRRMGLDAFAIMSQSKISFSIARISKILGTKFGHRYIVFPKTLTEANIKKEEFMNKYGVPGIVGLIDCTHIAIANVNKMEEYAYVNRKGYHSINTQMICDLNMRILGLNGRYPGSTHDSHIWDGSKINLRMQELNSEDNQTWLFGDSGYALKPYMMVPKRDPATVAEIQYNKMHSKIRSGIERCFGILKSRFRCLKTASGHLHYNHQRVANIVCACAVLHNMLINHNYPLEDISNEIEEIVPLNNATEDENSGEQNRQFLCNYVEERGIDF